MIRTSRSEEETIAIGESIGRSLRGGELIVLKGDLGAGKTRLVRGIARGAGSEDHVSSPTYVIQHIYSGRIPVHHIDLYRLRHHEDISDLGIDEALVAGAAVVVEWGEKLPAEVEDGRLEITISPGETETARVMMIPDELLP
ncbi:MAG: tRNA (adenosine(37)-N6)-threonylcarbamoyltransferase complex ATPase subunit type 1 TsaE [Candidatus Hydrogenedentota bacterium]